MFPGELFSIDPGWRPLAGVTYAVALITMLVRSRRNYLALPELAARAAQAHPPDCMVVIPARNEEDMIGRAVRSLPKDSVIVVDDDSTDGTAHEAEGAGAGVLRVPSPPGGVVGKAHACMAGASAIRTRWILFTDADTWFEEGFLESAIHAGEAAGLAFVSLHLRWEAESLAEHAIAPLVQALWFAGVDPRRSVEGAFLGQCVLVRRDAYEFVGGHRACLNFLLDDVRLAQLALRHRMQARAIRATGLGHARYQKGWGGLWEGVPRNALRLSLLEGVPAVLTVLTASLLFLWLPMVAGMWRVGAFPMAALILLLPPLLLAPWYRSPSRALLAVAAVYALLPIVAHTLYVMMTSTRVHWKGRVI